MPDPAPPPDSLRREIKRGIWGAARFASFDARGMHYFNVTRQGLRRSFLAALVSLPFFIAVIALSYRPTEIPQYLNIALGYGLSWVLFPLIMIPVLLALQLDKAYTPLIVAYNWAKVIVYGLSLVTALLFYTDTSLTITLTLAFRIVSMLYRWFVAKVALQSGILIPFVIVVIDEVIGAFLSRGLLHLFGQIPTVAALHAQ